MDRKYQIFISSTYTDLIEERKYVQDVILSMNHFPVGMELFSAASEEQWEIIKRTIDTSDFYVLIIGYRYGSEMPDGVGYTEREFLYAKEKGIPVIAFIKRAGLPVREADREASASGQKKLEEFIRRAKTGREVAWWSSKEELGQQVTISLYKEFQRVRRPGWIRATERPAELEIQELYRIIGQLRVEENQNLSENILETLRRILQRIQRLEEGVQGQAARRDKPDEDAMDQAEREMVEAANRLSLRFLRNPSSGQWIVSGQDCHVRLDCREGSASDLDVAMTGLLNEKVNKLSRSLPDNHCLRLRRVFSDRYASHGCWIDYLYDFRVLPIYTEGELFRFFETDFCGQIFEPSIRYIEEDFGQDRFDADDDKYDTEEIWQEKPVCYREGCYVADVVDVFVNEKRGDSFYRLDGVLPASVVGEEPVEGENHWLADWGHKKARCGIGDTVKFKLKKVYERKNWRHTSKARNIDFSELEVVFKR